VRVERLLEQAGHGCRVHAYRAAATIAPPGSFATALIGRQGEPSQIVIRLAGVACCRGWTMTDLLHHFGEVYLDKTECMRVGSAPDPWPPEGLTDEPGWSCSTGPTPP